MLDLYNNVDMLTGYHIFNNVRMARDDHFMEDYYQLMYREMKQNNIKGVNGLIRWLDQAGWYIDNEALFNYSLLHCPIEMFLMIYYICLFWSNDIDDRHYLQFDLVNNILTKNYKISVNNIFLTKNCIDYDYKFVAIHKINNKFGRLNYSDFDQSNAVGAAQDVYGVDIEIDHNYDLWHSFFVKHLLRFNIDMEAINTQFYKKYNQEWHNMSS